MTYQSYDGSLSFATDCWTSPNHRAFMAVTVHLVIDGEVKSVVLDVAELPRSHSGENLANKLAEILNDYGIADKVSNHISTNG